MRRRCYCCAAAVCFCLVRCRKHSAQALAFGRRSTPRSDLWHRRNAPLNKYQTSKHPRSHPQWQSCGSNCTSASCCRDRKTPSASTPARSANCSMGGEGWMKGNWNTIAFSSTLDWRRASWPSTFLTHHTRCLIMPVGGLKDSTAARCASSPTRDALPNASRACARRCPPRSRQ